MASWPPPEAPTNDPRCEACEVCHAHASEPILLCYHLKRRASRNRQLRNGLPQRLVLAPILFNIYTADYPTTSASKYLYADDSAIAAQAKTYEEIQTILEADVSILCNYFQLWHLKVSESKTVCSIYHLSTRLAK